MDGEMQTYNVYKVDLNFRAKVSIYTRECNEEAAGLLAQDKLEELLKNTFSEVLRIGVESVEYSKIDIYQ